jgi:hypothetical protein
VTPVTSEAALVVAAPSIVTVTSAELSEIATEWLDPDWSVTDQVAGAGGVGAVVTADWVVDAPEVGVVVVVVVVGVVVVVEVGVVEEDVAVAEPVVPTPVVEVEEGVVGGVVEVVCDEDPVEDDWSVVPDVVGVLDVTP